MRNLVIALSIAVALLAGCIIGATASRFVVPPAKAGTNPTKWEYYCFEDYGAEDVQKKADRAGLEGWELAASSGPGRRTSWCFKRRLR